MAFSSYSGKNDNGFTVIDNIFIRQFLPDAPPHCTDVYLVGLSLCGENDVNNTIEVMSRLLSLTADDIYSAYNYWEQLGIVNIVNTQPFQVIYLPINSTVNLLKKIKPSKYTSFNKNMQNILVERMITINEYNEYYLFLETTLFEPEALCEVAKYCVQIKGKDINYKYILTVARNLATKGIKTLEAVKESLDLQFAYTADLNMVFKALKVKRSADFDDKQRYETWTIEFGFTLDTILYVAKNITSGGMTRLDSKLNEYYKQNLFSVTEIESYAINKDNLYSLAKDINRSLGLYYTSLDQEISDYVSVWLNRGYDADTLKEFAHYCFVCSIRSLDGMNKALESLYKLGNVSFISVQKYIDEVLDTNRKIKSILDDLGLKRNVTKLDRTFYKCWTQDWSMSNELIDYALTLASNSQNPMLYLNKILSNFKQNNIDTVEKAKKQSTFYYEKNVAASKTKQDNGQRQYSQEELKALFDNLDEVEV